MSLFRNDEKPSEMPRQRFADLLCGRAGKVGAKLDVVVLHLAFVAGYAASVALGAHERGQTTLAPARMPRSLPSGEREANAVVAGIKAEGYINRKMDKSFKVSSMLPAGSFAKGVSA